MMQRQPQFIVKLAVIPSYAPTNEAEDETKDVWYEQLQATVSKELLHDMLLVFGDINTKIGSDNTNKWGGLYVAL